MTENTVPYHLFVALYRGEKIVDVAPDLDDRKHKELDRVIFSKLYLTYTHYRGYDGKTLDQADQILANLASQALRTLTGGYTGEQIYLQAAELRDKYQGQTSSPLRPIVVRG